LETAHELLRHVYPKGSKSREASWWLEGVGAFDDESIDALPGSLLIPDKDDDSLYFNDAFTEDEALVEYHMNPYWCLYSLHTVSMSELLS
jgi:hypothetical protein